MELSGNLKNERKPVTCYNTVYNVKNIIRSQKTNIVLSHSFEESGTCYNLKRIHGKEVLAYT